ncbi:MAG: hypothetical protein ABWY00_17145 [Dongiaceae bacterium]
MKSSRVPFKILSLLVPMALALSVCASSSSYAEVVISTGCPPYYDGWGCPNLYPYGVYYGDGWWDRDHWHHADYHGYDHGYDRGYARGFANGYNHGVSPDFADGGLNHGGFAHGEDRR